MFSYDGKEMSVAEYFDRKHKRRLRNPELPCVVEKIGKDKFYYPIEVLEVPDNQRGKVFYSYILLSFSFF